MMAEQKPVDVTRETLHKRKIAMLILGGIFILIAIIWLVYWFIWGQFSEYTDDAYVTGNMVQLMPQIAGTVTEINTDNTQFVEKGQILVKLDATDYRLALQKAQADLGQTVRQVRQYFDNADKARQGMVINKATRLKAELDLKRRKGLVGNRAVSREEMQHYLTAMEAAEAEYKASQYTLDAALALIDNSTVYTHPMVQTAKANVRKAWLDLHRTTILAPVTGFVAQRNIHPGQQVNPGTPMMAIIPLQDTWVDANYKESSLDHIRVNQPVTIYVDAYPDFTYHGKVVGLNAGTGSVFSLLPPQNATGNWIKIVQRLPVRIRLDADELKKNPLQLGLSTRVTINTHNRKGTRMPVAADAHYHYETSVFDNQLQGVDAAIASILKANSANLSLPEATS